MQKWSDNQQLLPSYEMNIPRVVVFLERKQPLEGWQFDVHLIRRQSLLYYTESTQGCFITWMLCFEENQIISGIGNAITEPDCIKRIFVGQGCLWTSVSLYIICVLVVHRVVSLVFKTSKMYCKELYKVYGLGMWSNTCTKSGSLRFSQFSGCWLILSVYILTSFDFPFVRLFGNFVITLVHMIYFWKRTLAIGRCNAIPTNLSGVVFYRYPYLSLPIKLTHTT
jgi:hypothetical protein